MDENETKYKQHNENNKHLSLMYWSLNPAVIDVNFELISRIILVFPLLILN